MQLAAALSFGLLVVTTVVKGMPERDSRRIASVQTSNVIITGSPKEGGKGEEGGPVLQCRGGVSNWCRQETCTFKCGDGTQLEMECQDNRVYISSNNGVSEVYCGEDAPEVQFPPCFPWCDSGPPKIPTFPPCFPFCDY